MGDSDLRDRGYKRLGDKDIRDIGDMGDVGELADLGDMGDIGGIGELADLGDMGDMGVQDMGDTGDKDMGDLRGEARRPGEAAILACGYGMADPHVDPVHHRFEPPVRGRHLLQLEGQVVHVVQRAAPKELCIHALLLARHAETEG